MPECWRPRSAGSTPSCSRPASARTRRGVRERIAQKLEWLGAELDPNANASGNLLISRTDSAVALYVVPTDEELMIARHTLALMPASCDPGAPSA